MLDYDVPKWPAEKVIHLILDYFVIWSLYCYS